MTSRAKRVSVGIALAVAAFAAACVVAWRLAGPAWVEHWAFDELRRQGIPISAMTVQSLDLGRAEIVDVRVDWGGGLTIDRIEAAYRPLRLIKERRLDRVDVTGSVAVSATASSSSLTPSARTL